MSTQCQHEIPEIEGLAEPTQLIHDSIDVLEQLCVGLDESGADESWVKIDYGANQYARQVRAELRELIRVPDRSAFMNLSVAFWRLLDQKQDKIILFCRERSPVANLVAHMCRGSRLSEDLLNGRFVESDFPVLTVSAGVLALAPIRICDAREPDVFLRVLFEAYPYFDCALCDWTLAAAENTAVRRMTRNSPIALLCPQRRPIQENRAGPLEAG